MNGARHGDLDTAPWARHKIAWQAEAPVDSAARAGSRRSVDEFKNYKAVGSTIDRLDEAVEGMLTMTLEIDEKVIRTGEVTPGMSKDRYTCAGDTMRQSPVDPKDGHTVSTSDGSVPSCSATGVGQLGRRPCPASCTNVSSPYRHRTMGFIWCAIAGRHPPP